MNGKDKPLGMNHVSAKYIEEAETVTCLKKRDPAAAVYFLGLSRRIRCLIQVLRLQSKQHMQIP